MKFLITGGTGSFGGTVVRRLLDDPNVQEIRVFSRDEKKQDDMRHQLDDNRLKFYIGDVRDQTSVTSVMKDIDYVFHAAALKQVPSCELFPIEALKTNVLGTDNILRTAEQAGVKKVICLSTDKAVYPINAMGTSKAMMEKIALAQARTSSTCICLTRYGNVIGSRGSVIPLFINQIKAGQSLTITNGDMTRFMMNLSESVDLVLLALNSGQPGDLFVQKAPAATVETIALALLKIFGSKVNTKIIGSRPGEKIHETLLTREESTKSEDIGEYFRVPQDERTLDYSLYENGQMFTELRAYTSENTKRLNVDETIDLLLKIDYVRDELK